jgi:hypothetical protein
MQYLVRLTLEESQDTPNPESYPPTKLDEWLATFPDDWEKAKAVFDEVHGPGSV